MTLASGTRGRLDSAGRLGRLGSYPGRGLSALARGTDLGDRRPPDRLRIHHGIDHILLPTFARWRTVEPDVTERAYPTVLADVRRWARRERVPLTVEPDACFHFEEL